MEGIVYTEEPTLYRPDFVLGFEGWPNAGEVSSFAVEYLIDTLKAKRFATLPPEKFNPMASSRPSAVIKEGRLLDMKFPVHHFYYWKNPSSHDLILFRGLEPQSHWGTFGDLLLGLAEKFGVSRIFTLGGTFDFIPHTFPPLVSAVYTHDDLRETVVRAGLSLTEYTGPVSIHTFLLRAARKRGIRAISLWGHTPQYLQTKNIRVALAVVKKLMELTELEVDLSDLEKACDYFDQQVKQLVDEDPKLTEMITRLQEVYQQSGRLPPLPEREKEEKEEEKVIYIQAFLKRQEDEEQKEK